MEVRKCATPLVRPVRDGCSNSTSIVTAGDFVAKGRGVGSRDPDIIGGGLLEGFVRGNSNFLAV